MTITLKAKRKESGPPGVTKVSHLLQGEYKEFLSGGGEFTRHSCNGRSRLEPTVRLAT